MVLSVTKSSIVVSSHHHGKDLGDGGRVNVKGGFEDQKASSSTNANATAESLRHCMNQRLLMMKEAKQSRRRLSREGDAAGKSLSRNETPSVPYLSTLFKDSTILKSLVVVTNDDDDDDEMKVKTKKPSSSRTDTTSQRREPRRRASLDDRHYSTNGKNETHRRTSLSELVQTAAATSASPTVKSVASKHIEDEEELINEESGLRGLYNNKHDEKQDETNRSLRLEKILKESEEACSSSFVGGGGDGSSTVLSDASLPFIPRNEVYKRRGSATSDFNNTSTTIYEQSSDDDESSKHNHRSNKHVTSDSNEREEALRKEVQQLRETLRLTSMELSLRDTQHQQELCAQQMKVNELEREKTSLEEELQNYMKENDELVHDVMDSQMMIDELKTKNTAQEEALTMLAKRNDELEQQRDDLREEVLQISGKTYRDNTDIELVQHKFDEYKRFTKKEKASMLSDQTELQARLDQVTKERDELEKRLASLMMMSSNKEQQTRSSSATRPTGLYDKSYRRGSSFDLFSTTTSDEPRRPSSDIKAKNNMSYSSADHSSASSLVDPATGQPIVIVKQSGVARRRGSWMDLGNKAIEAFKGTTTTCQHGAEPQPINGGSSNATWTVATGNGGQRRTSTTAPSPAFQLSLAPPSSPSPSPVVVSHTHVNRRRSFIDLETLKKSSERELATVEQNSLENPTDPFAGTTNSIAAAAAAVAAEYFCSDDEDDEDDTFHCSSSPRSNSASNKLCTTDTCTSSKVTSRRRASTTGMAYPSLQNLGK